MKVVIQRVIDASVSVDAKVVGSINYGLLVYLGVASVDDKKDADWLAEKIPNLRIFNDENGAMNLSLLDIKNAPFAVKKIGILVVSQFTLLADARKGRRPSWNGAASPQKAKELYEYFITKLKEQDIYCECGEFQACMRVTYTKEGPVTILLDSKDRR